MNTMNTVFGILILVMSVFLVATILLQSSKDHRMSGTIAGGAETFFGKQKGKTMDGMLNKLTAVVCVIFFIIVLVMYILQPNTDSGISLDGSNITVDENGNLVLEDGTVINGDNLVVDENGNIVIDGAEADGTETEGTEAEGTEAEGTETEGTEAEGTETEGTETEGTETEGIEAEEPETETETGAEEVEG